MKKLGLLFGAVVAALSLAAAPASAYPPDDEPLTLSVAVVTPGGSFTATLVGCSLGETVTFTLDGITVEVTCTGPAGSRRLPSATGEAVATATLTAPTTPGTYEIVATGLTSGVTGTSTITVVAPGGDADDGGGTIPQTGSDSSIPTAQIAGGFVVVGAGLAGVAGIRRRKTAHTA